MLIELLGVSASPAPNSTAKLVCDCTKSVLSSEENVGRLQFNEKLYRPGRFSSARRLTSGTFWPAKKTTKGTNTLRSTMCCICWDFTKEYKKAQSRWSRTGSWCQRWGQPQRNSNQRFLVHCVGGSTQTSGEARTAAHVH